MATKGVIGRQKQFCEQTVVTDQIDRYTVGDAEAESNSKKKAKVLYRMWWKNTHQTPLNRNISQDRHAKRKRVTHKKHIECRSKIGNVFRKTQGRNEGWKAQNNMKRQFDKK